MSHPPSTWRAAVCYDSPSISRKTREALDTLGWTYDRDRSERHFSKLMVVIAIPQASYVFQFLVRDPGKFVINVYDEKPTHSGLVHYIEVKGITKKNAKHVRRFLQTFSDSLPRKPYRIFWVERLKLGFIRFEHITAKREWSRWGI